VSLSCTEEYNGTSWSAGGALATARYGPFTGGGTQGAGLAAGGTVGGVTRTCTEEYLKSSYTIVDCFL
jgi:hypothetical protein